MNLKFSICLLFALQAHVALAATPEEHAGIISRAQNVLAVNCQRCHNSPESEGGFDILNVPQLFKDANISEAKPTESKILTMIAEGRMPPKPARMFAEDTEAIRQWLAIGAPSFPQREFKRPRIELEKVLATVRDHLLQAAPKDRSYYRFFTLHHAYNNSARSEADLRLQRAALSKALNSLSWNAKITPPLALDPESTVFRIDLRDYDWVKGGQWNKILQAYPYGLSYRDLPAQQKNLATFDTEIQSLTGSSIPLIRADWFIASATRPPLYHRILDIPANAKKLEEQNGVDIAANFQAAEVSGMARAGFHQSGVSGQNRLVERHSSKYGYFWKSYDFKPDSGRSKLTRFPLGPLNLFPKGKHPFTSQAFVHDGGEIIFSLPNQLQAYMLVDGKDDIIDAGPIEVVSDALKTSGSNVIVNGVSCMACHKHGMIEANDVIRDSSALFGEAEQHVNRLYPTQTELNKLLSDDRQRFMKALRKTLGEFLQQDADRQRPLEDFAEPVSEVARPYRLEYLDAAAIANELDLASPKQLLETVGATRLKRLGLETLLRPGGRISRLEWESGDGESLMQELATEFRYTPRRVFAD